MKYRIVLEDGYEHEVEVEERDDGLVILVDGVAHPVEIHMYQNGEALATVDNRPYALRITREGEKFALDLPSGRSSVQIEEEAVWMLKKAATRRRASAEPSKGEIRSPITGVVLSLPLTIGKDVAAGDTVLVIEAMKMENAIAAPQDGKLVKLFVKVGDTVKVGQPLALVQDSHASKPNGTHTN